METFLDGKDNSSHAKSTELLGLNSDYGRRHLSLDFVGEPKIIVSNAKDISFGVEKYYDRIKLLAPPGADAFLVGLPVFNGNEGYVPIQFYKIK